MALSVGKGWRGETQRHSDAKKYGRAGGVYASGYKSKIKLGEKPKTIYDAEDLTDKQLNELTSKQVQALEKGRVLKSRTIVKNAREEQIKDLEERYKLLATGEAIDSEKELEIYREDKAQYVQYLNEKEKTEKYLLDIQDTDEQFALQKLGEDIFSDLDKESPRTTQFLRDNPDVKVHFVEEEKFQKFLQDEKGDTYLGAKRTNGIYYNVDKELYVSVDLDKRPDGTFALMPRERSVVKEVLIHEVAHAKRDKAIWKNFKEDWSNLFKPQLSARWKLFKQRNKLSSGEYKSRIRQLDQELEAKELTYVDPEYISYHYQDRMGRRIHRPFVKQVKDKEVEGDYTLDNYRAHEEIFNLPVASGF